MTNKKYKLVPLEPTPEMVEAAREHHEGEAYLPVSVYKAMLAAAPAVQGEAVEYGWRLIAVNEAWDALERALSRACNKGYMPVTMGAEWNAFDWTEAPQPEEQQPAPDESALVEALEDIGASWHGVQTELEKYMRNVARRALAAHRKQQEGQP